jgi:Tol biopolymer transport system component/DNA-binding winged helix-turn-helix (wHTH) protein
MSYTIGHFYRFGEFAVDADQLILLRGDKPVPLAPKVFDVLLVLLEHRGRIVGKNELMNRLWPDSFVEENNLTFNIGQLRKALGDDAHLPKYVETVARRGYRFIAEVEEVLADTGATQGQIKVAQNSSKLNAGHLYEAAGIKPRSDSYGLRLRPRTQSPVHTAATVDQDISDHPSQHWFINKSKILAIVAGTLLVTFLVTSAIWGVYLRNNSNRPQKRDENLAAVPAISLMSPKMEKLTATGKNKHAVISLDGKFVAYTAEVRGRVSIWLRQFATGSVREFLSFTEGRIYGMAFGHTGEYLYFVKGYPEPTALYRVPMPLGGVPTKLISTLEGTFSLSADDTQVAYVRYSEDDKECALMIANADGSHERALSVHAQPDRFNTPAWSPDGQSVAVASGPSDKGDREVRIIEVSLTSGAEKQMSSERWFHISRIVWLADKSALIIVGEKEPGQTKTIWKIAYPNGDVTQLTDGLSSFIDVSTTADADKAVATQMALTSDIWIGPANEPETELKRVTHAVGSFCWTPDDRIIYSSYANADRNLWIMKLDGTDQRQLTSDGENLDPTVTPDGRYIVFISNRGGVFRIWRMNADGSNQIQLADQPSANHPAISHDGRWVIYHSVEDGTLWKVSIEGGRSLQLSERFAFWPSLSPDGKLIASVEKGDKKDRRLLLVPIGGGRPLRNLEVAPFELASYRLQWSSDSTALFYAALHDGVTSLYRQSIEGGLPKKLFSFSGDDIFDFNYSPEHHHLAVIRGGWQFDVVLLTGLTSKTTVASRVKRPNLAVGHRERYVHNPSRVRSS